MVTKHLVLTEYFWMNELFTLMSVNMFSELLYDFEGCYKVDIFRIEESTGSESLGRDGIEEIVKSFK